MLGRQIGADERLEPRAIGWLSVEALTLCAQLVGEDVRDEILLRGEVAVEGPIRKAGVRHDGRHARPVDSVLLETPPGRLDDSLPRHLLVVLAVAHSRTSFGTALNRRRRLCHSAQYYDRTTLLWS